jgi:DNA invertase Pin-like site-specific DNA recombinase
MWWNYDIPAPKAKAIAYYRHSAEDRQEYSIPIQQEQVRQLAHEHNIQIVEEFKDYGKSGLGIKGRDEFKRMLDYVVDTNIEFEYIFVLDVSRWGRFQDLDLSAHYMWFCKQHGRKVVFTKMGFQDDDDPMQQLILTFERARAATYSRELSDKVFRGCVKIADMGFWAGGYPPYGLSRLLLNEQRHPVQLLEKGQRKSIQNQRVTLAPSQDKEVVERIYNDFTKKKRNPKEIAHSLNKDNISSPGGKEWSNSMVKCILTNEIYAGTMIYNRTRQKLQSRTERNPKEEWVRTENAFQGIVSTDLFRKTQDIFRKQNAEQLQRHSADDMLCKLKVLFDEYGMISARQISHRKNMLSPHAYTRKFHSLGLAFQEIFSKTLQQARLTVMETLNSKARKMKEYKDYLVLNDCFSLIIQPSIPVPYGYQIYWAFRPDPRVEVDLTLGVPLSNNREYDILGYLVFPRILVSSRTYQLFSSSDNKLELHGHNNLDLIDELLH